MPASDRFVSGESATQKLFRNDLEESKAEVSV
jgi:hypothetical protein